MVKYPDLRSDRSDTLMLTTTTNTTPQIDAATAATINACEHGFGRGPVLGSVIALAARYAQ
jgi:hypothetical protein